MARLPAPLLACWLLWTAVPVPAQEAGGWHKTDCPHFTVSHEQTWMPPGFVMSLEKMHSRLRLDLGMFSPWMAKDKIKLYLYGSKGSYVGGEFHPPEWSNGIALYQDRVVAVFNVPDPRKLMGTISHETTHMLFEGYWGEVGKRPPAWINEGLATMEEGESPEHPERSQWYQAMSALPGQKLLSLQQVLSITPTQDLSDQKEVETWYTEAFSVTYYLYHQHSRLQFKSFVSKLRDGTDLAQALWQVYRYQSIDKFERAWLAWALDPIHRKKVDALLEAPAGVSSQESIGGIPGFRPLRP